MPEISQKKLISIILIGSILETYDFMLYGYFAAILAKQFFPIFNSASSLLLTFTIFSLGFFTRPLGAAIFGSLGDKYGRRVNLLISIILMAVPTTLIGLLPTYAQIGFAAGVLLTVCRLLQGISVGAEFAGSMVYMIELAPPNKRSFYGSLSIWSGYVSMLFTALIVTFLTSICSQSALESWGWRIPFLFGLVLGIVGLYIRANIPETPAFKKLIRSKARSAHPLWQTFKEMPLTLLNGIGITLLHTSGFYLLFVYFNTYLITYYQAPTALVSLLNTIATLIAVLTIPVIGFLAEKINKKTLLIFSCTSFILFSYPLFILLAHQSFISILIIQTILTVMLCISSALVPSFLAEMFPVNLRYTGLALSYNIAGAAFGGTAPALLTFLVDKTQNPAAPGIYLMCAAFVTLVAVLMLKTKPGDVPAEALSEENYGGVD